jgi:hypothetical protein
MHCVNFFIPISTAHVMVQKSTWAPEIVWVIIKGCTLKNELLLTELKRTTFEKLSRVSAFVKRKLEWIASFHCNLKRGPHNMSKLQGLKDSINTVIFRLHTCGSHFSVVIDRFYYQSTLFQSSSSAIVNYHYLVRIKLLTILLHITNKLCIKHSGMYQADIKIMNCLLYSDICSSDTTQGTKSWLLFVFTQATRFSYVSMICQSCLVP